MARSAKLWLYAPAILPEWHLPLPPRWQDALARGRRYVGVRTVLEMGGSTAQSSESRVTEASVRGFWKAYRSNMGM